MRVCVARKYGGIGDILMMTPGIRGLCLAGHEVSVAIDTNCKTYCSLLKNNQHIKEIYNYTEVDREAFDSFVDLTSVAYPYEQAGFNLSRQQIFANEMGVTVFDEKPIYTPVAGYPVDNLVALHFFADEEKRSWPKSHAVEVIEFLLATTKAKLLFLDTEDYFPLTDRIISCKDLSVEESSKYLWAAKFFIGVDSGWMHLAAALDVSGLVLFGSTSPEMRIKGYRYLDAVFTPSECNNCFYRSCELDYDCMRSISPGMVIEKIKTEALLF
jgi:ADP-heptose:LPS heptosyltransferase